METAFHRIARQERLIAQGLWPGEHFVAPPAMGPIFGAQDERVHPISVAIDDELQFPSPKHRDRWIIGQVEISHQAEIAPTVRRALDSHVAAKTGKPILKVRADSKSGR